MKTLKDLGLKTIEAMKEVSDADLVAEIKASEKKLFGYKMKLVSNELKQTHFVTVMRRYVASLKTIASSRGINI